jgi:protein TonB
MFRNSLIGSLILHVLLLIGANFILTDNAVSKAIPIDRKIPICIELVREPSAEKSLSVNDENGRIRQPEGFPKRKGIPAAAAAKFADSLPKPPAAAGKSITEPQTPHDKGPAQSVKAESGLKLEQRPPVNASPVAAATAQPVKAESGLKLEQPSPVNASPVATATVQPVKPDSGETGESTKGESGPAVDGKNPDAGPGAGRLRGNGSGVGGGDSEPPGTSRGKGGAGGAGSGGRSLIYAPRPFYPMQARRNNWEGAVLVEIRIGPDGRVQKETVLQSSGYPVLDQAAQKAIQKWRYRPARKNGVAVASQLRVRVKFCLTDWED